MKTENMAKVSPKMKCWFQNYVKDVSASAANLTFLLDNLGYAVSIDGSRESLVALEKIYWELNQKGIPPGLSDLEQLAQLIGQYLGKVIIEHTGAKWVQCTDANPTLGQPCLDEFGNEPWDRIFPVALANNLPVLKLRNPHFLGARNQTVFASQLDKALNLSAKKAPNNFQ
ncbi:hypothetical protein [Prosthecobacter sp.]|uniref:hypothetical protein n=1 Tax=Prosthecobacter sp. TaxID=1965333 RepID=UPI003783393F